MTPDRWRQIEDLYHAAQKCSPGERSALLEGTDPEIRSRVERMLELESGDQLLDRQVELLPSFTTQAVPVGEQLGPYRIEAQIGAGGMATVYRAVDTRLGRIVAIKIARERYSERFQQEARAISTLNHPNICTLYDVGPNYLVMEFIEGSTLAAELRKGPLDPEAAARYGAQIAGALAEAHALGIVHRDLKPANIMLTRHGIKVLDFGLAKIVSDIGITETGGIMGTPAYMAPEQLDSLEPSAQADLFSLGLVIYEMAVGKLPFPGASLGQMLASGSAPAIPVPSRERLGIPAQFDRLVARLLERDPAKRPRAASDVARDLRTLAERLAARPSRIRSLLRPAYGIIALAMLCAAGVLIYLRSKTHGDEAPIINDPHSYTQLTSFTDSATWPVLSADGRMLAFYRSINPFLTPDEIWVKLLPNGEPVQVTHDPRPKYDIAFSPDNSQIAYTAMDRLFETYTVSSLGGDSQLMFPNAAGLSWLDDRHLLFSRIKTGVHMGVVTSNSDQSAVREIYYPVRERGMAHYSYLSPDKQSVLLAEMDPQWHPCRVVPFSGGSPGRQVGPDGACTSAAWSPDGKWMYLGVEVGGHRHLWRQRFPYGKPEQITFGSTEEDGIAVAPDGRSLITSIFTQQNTVWIHDSHGDRPLSTEGYAEYAPPVFSKDGKRLYYVMRRDSPESPAELWRTDLASGTSEVAVPGVSISRYELSSDEKQVVFATQPPGQASQLWIAPLDRSAPPRKIGLLGDAVPHFSQDGRVLFRLTEGTVYYLGVMNADGSGRRKYLPRKILSMDQISSDRRVLVIGDESSGSFGQEPGMTLLSLGTGKVQKLSAKFVDNIAWSPDGRYFYIQIKHASRQDPTGQTAAIRVPAGQTLPPIPPGTVEDFSAWRKVPGVKIIDRTGVAPGPNPSTYAYINFSIHANLFRIPLR